ncbi:poly-beta-hydroxybutyrate-responsive repressor [Alkalihalobacterium alkalinitrilicum]|uniref:poly-beta-hydroxybutyrate-responsive repressor n=1 Tax=Alkalihalobacterium alkalinitrilicum TaxID=427920 RepID=UPI0009951D6E|nr:poly-beta-hydroxybutyrate-responsive repressor [Alkalihalobacterium alkalinitrilicum]
MANENKETSISPSKNFVLPFILLILSRMSLHGYELNQKLQSFGFHTVDQGNLYRLLRKLEKENLVKSEWDTTGSGPAKRLYSITDVGKNFLQGYAKKLELYQSMLDQFFNMYSSFLDLYIPSFNKEDKIEQKKDHKRRNENESKSEAKE